MNIYLELILCKEGLKVASIFAWDNRLNITIIHHLTGHSYIVVDESTEKEEHSNEYIEVEDFSTYDDFYKHLTTTIIGI